MKFYSTILLILLFVPGLSDCQGCMEEIDKKGEQECEDLRQQLSEAKREQQEAWDAYIEASRNSGTDPKTLSDLDSDFRAKSSAHWKISDDIRVYCE